MKHRTLLLFASVAALAACGDTTPTAPGADSAVDAAADGALDAAADAAAPDVASDAAPDRASIDVVDAPAPDAPLADATPGDAPADRAAVDVTTDASGCNGDAPSCVSGTVGGTCGDALTIATCSGGAWRCGEGMVLTSQCACIGRPPGPCTCGPAGWICDAGVAPDASALVDCDPSHALCDRIPPVCAGGGEVASVSGSCWGPCVLYTRCMPIACDPAAPACPTNLVCYRTTRLCGPPL